MEIEKGTEAVELYNWLSNERRFYARMVEIFRRFEYEMKWGDFVGEHCEARLMPIANEAAMGYVKEFCLNNVRYRDVFPLTIRRECAALMTREFLVESGAGNSWL